jgi:uncharacterized protein (TIGR03000 family)
MRPSHTTRTPWYARTAGAGLTLLALAAIGLTNCQAQMYYSGGFIVHHRHPWNVTQPPPTPAQPPQPPSYFPDNDFFYPAYTAAATSVRPSYYSEEEVARSVPSSVGAPPLAVPAAALPWNQAGFKEYDELPEMVQDASLVPPRKYVLEATPLPQGAPPDRLEAAVLIAHLPARALLWVEGRLTRLTAPTRSFRSPPLFPGKKYTYTVRAAWIEEGRWVSQTVTVPVRAGLSQAIYLRAK